MAITMQRAWTVTVTTKSAAFAQRVVVSRPGSADIMLAGVVGNSIFVDAPQWSIDIQHQVASGQPWIGSAQRITFPAVSAGLLHFDIDSDDGGGSDHDYDDLILRCSMPVSASEFVVYG